MPANNCSKRVKFFIFDGYISLPLIFLLLFPSMTMLYFLLGMSIVLFIFDRRGMPLPMLARRIRTMFIGRNRYVRPHWRKN
jgi:hypothetical protein